MSKVERYLRKNYSKENRYWCFERIEKILAPAYSIVSDAFMCPICGEMNHREDWDNVDEFEPKCLYCHSMVAEGDEEYDD